jgi:glycosyltransferase involved in cell wall biosynthesis
MNQATQSEILISIVVVTHERPQYLAECLNSCQRQSYRNREIVVVLNPTQIESEMIALKHGAKILRTHRNIGFFPALNIAIASSSGSRIMVIDDDAAFEGNDILTRLNHVLDEHAQCVVVTCNLHGPCESEPYRETREVHGFKTGFGLFRREVFSDIAGYVPDKFFREGGESYLTNYIYEHGHSVMVVHDAWMFHAQTPIGRDRRLMNHYSIRNHALIALLQEPLVVILPSLAMKVASTFTRIAIQRRDPLSWITGWNSLLLNIPWAIRMRKPISLRTFLRLRKLRAETGRHPGQ